MEDESIIKLEDRIILALDDWEFVYECINFLDKLSRTPYAVKIHSLWDKQGSVAVEQLKWFTNRIFVDLKLKDIPRTVGVRAKIAKEVGVDFLTVFADGGVEMMRAAVENGPEIIAVTVLTSLSSKEVQCIYGGEQATVVATRFAMFAKESGIKYIVCSSQEVSCLSEMPQLAGMEFWVPGIRRTGESSDDQTRFDTPSAAIKSGATRLVIGSSITKARDPKKAFDEISSEIESALSEINAKEVKI